MIMSLFPLAGTVFDDKDLIIFGAIMLAEAVAIFLIILGLINLITSLKNKKSKKNSFRLLGTGVFLAIITIVLGQYFFGGPY